MTDLVEFIQARLDREEDDARLISSGGYQAQEWRLADPTEQALEIDDETYLELRAVDRVIGDPPGDLDEDSGVVAYVRTGRNEHLHMERYDPARMLREVDAKRRLLDLHGQEEPDGHDSSGYRFRCSHCDQTAPCPSLRLLALPYADHPDYRQEEWAP